MFGEIIEQNKKRQRQLPVIEAAGQVHSELQHAQAEAKAEEIVDVVNKPQPIHQAVEHPAAEIQHAQQAEPHAGAKQPEHRAEAVQQVPPAETPKEITDLMQRHHLSKEMAVAVAKRLKAVNSPPSTALKVEQQKQAFSAH